MPLRLFFIPVPTVPHAPPPGDPPLPPPPLLPVKFAGVTLGSGIATNSGGAISNGGKLTVVNSVVKNSESGGSGGAIYSASTSQLRLYSCQFTGNKATVDGGAVFVGDDAQVSIYGSTFSENRAGRGGAVAMLARTSLLIDGAVDPATGMPVVGPRSRFETNVAQHGGAVAVLGGLGSSATLKQSDFVENQATAGEGGAVYASAGPGATISFDGCTFTLNTATSHGGAVSLSAWDGVFSFCPFTDNNAAVGGSAVAVKAGQSASFQTCAFSNTVAPTTRLICAIGSLFGANPTVVVTLTGCTGIPTRTTCTNSECD